eukprot:9449349-Alexandrium_andersonii.AAC.1
MPGPNLTVLPNVVCACLERLRRALPKEKGRAWSCGGPASTGAIPRSATGPGALAGATARR